MTDALPQKALQKRSLEEAIGAGMSINVLQTALRHLLDAAGLTSIGGAQDWWIRCPAANCHDLSNQLWNKYGRP